MDINHLCGQWFGVICSTDILLVVSLRCKSRMKTMYIRISTPTRIRTRAQTNLESYFNRHHTTKFLAILASNDYNASHVSTCRTVYALSLVFRERTTPYSMYCFLPSPELLLDHMPGRIRHQDHEMTTRSNYSSENPAYLEYLCRSSGGRGDVDRMAPVAEVHVDLFL
jgi:hypothetical protein